MIQKKTFIASIFQQMVNIYQQVLMTIKLTLSSITFTYIGYFYVLPTVTSMGATHTRMFW